MRLRFYDPSFASVEREVERVIDVAWDNYEASRKSPRTRRAGPEFSDPNAELAVEWLDAHDAIADARRRFEDPRSKPRVLLVSASPRSEHTCPSEMSKTFRLALIGKEAIESEGFEVDHLELSRLTSEYGRVIYPCKACVSTAMPLCHWPCSCYPNNSLGQVNDWMNEIYPRWVAAHGVLIVTPVHWYQVPSTLKSMMDRLVCADGGNPDPTTTGGKDGARAKALELEGWHYPRHLAGRAFSVVVHGDTDGVDPVRRALTDWLTDMHLIPADPSGGIGRYVGYYAPYATSHLALDADEGLQGEMRNAACSLVRRICMLRDGIGRSDEQLSDPRPK